MFRPVLVALVIAVRLVLSTPHHIDEFPRLPEFCERAEELCGTFSGGSTYLTREEFSVVSSKVSSWRFEEDHEEKHDNPTLRFASDPDYAYEISARNTMESLRNYIRDRHQLTVVDKAGRDVLRLTYRPVNAYFGVEHGMILDFFRGRKEPPMEEALHVLSLLKEEKIFSI